MWKVRHEKGKRTGATAVSVNKSLARKFFPPCWLFLWKYGALFAHCFVFAGAQELLVEAKPLVNRGFL